MKIPSSCLPTCLPVCLTVCLYVCLSIFLSVFLLVCLCIRLSVNHLSQNWFIQVFSLVFSSFYMIFKRWLKSRNKRARFLCKTLEKTALSKNSLKWSQNLVFNVSLETWSLRFSLSKPKKSYYEMLLNPAIILYRNIIFVMLQSKILSKK